METKVLHGGEFLVKDAHYNDVFIPEEMDEEQQMIVQTVRDYLETEVYPFLDRIDAQEVGLMRKLIGKAGELGLLGIAIPEEYEGFGQSFLTTMIANEAIGTAYSYSVAYMAHTGIGTLPLLYYGNEEQKQKYIPRLASGDKAAAYCLTEPGAGSDANSGRSKAVLSEDGKHYILNGQKMWITNGGFADLLTVFAKIDNDRVLSAFLVESNWEGVTMNPEEKKMGIKGSSTRQIFFNDVKVPVENLLGKRGEGFRIALNILHIGRLKLGINVVGASKRAITQSVQYANERKQFGHLISDFGAIKFKLAEQVIRTFTSESAVYRASKDIDDLIQQYKAEGKEHGKATVEGSAHFATECALLKVLGSETLDYVVDEAVQIYGGMGFSAETPVDRAYRDSRINRIFEGTNEINRLLVTETAIKTAQKGIYDLFGPAEKVMSEIENLKEENAPEGFYEQNAFYVKSFKKAVLAIIATATEQLKKQLYSEQEIMMNIADMIMPVYAAESTLLRIQKLEDKDLKTSNLELFKDILNIYVYDSAASLRKFAYDALASLPEQNEKLYKAIDIFTSVKPLNVKEGRRKIADQLIDDNFYKF
jgi:alkylation response protein AidB-like acyl-CoA dehydrogenase